MLAGDVMHGGKVIADNVGDGLRALLPLPGELLRHGGKAGNVGKQERRLAKLAADLARARVGQLLLDQVAGQVGGHGVQEGVQVVDAGLERRRVGSRAIPRAQRVAQRLGQVAL